MYVEHNKFIVIKIKYETWIAKQFIATYVRNLNYTGQQNLTFFLAHEEKYIILIELLTLNSNM